MIEQTAVNSYLTSSAARGFLVLLILSVFACGSDDTRSPQNDDVSRVDELCELAPDTPINTYVVSKYLRLYPSSDLALSNSLDPQNIVVGFSENDKTVVFSDQIVDRQNRPVEVTIPIWMSTPRLDLTNQNTGSVSGTVGRAFNSDLPGDISIALSGVFLEGANKLPVTFGCTVDNYTLVYLTGYFYRSDQLTDYLAPLKPSVEDTPAAGETDSREPNRLPTVDPTLPKKDGGDIGVMRPEDDDKASVERVLGGDPADVFAEYNGDGVKKIPSTIEDLPANGPQVASPETSDTRFARITFDIIANGEISARRAVAVPGELLTPNTLKGKYIWVVSDNTGIVEVGSFLDPLEQHTAVFDESVGPVTIPPAEQGSFRISLSPDLVGEKLRQSDILFYRLDAPLPPNTVLNATTIDSVLNTGSSVKIGSARGSDLYFQFGESLDIRVQPPVE